MPLQTRSKELLTHLPPTMMKSCSTAIIMTPYWLQKLGLDWEATLVPKPSFFEQRRGYQYIKDLSRG